MAERPTSKNPNTRRTILVTGATGRQGGAVARRLRQRGFPVRALTRHPDDPKARTLIGEGAEVVRGDYEDPPSLARALEDVYGVFSVQTPFPAGVESEVRQGIALADAAQRSAISHFVYSSVVAADAHTGIPHFESKFRVEEHLRGLGLPYTIVRPAFFMENWLGMLREGALALPLTPDCKLQQIAVDDIGGLVTLAFEHPATWQGRAVELAADERSMAEVAEIFSRVLGREIHYVQVSWDEFERQAGHEMTVMYRWFQEHGYHADIAALRQQYPRLTSLEQWARAQDWKEAAGDAAMRAR